MLYYYVYQDMQHWKIAYVLDYTRQHFEIFWKLMERE
jgi:hypothetical protein